jgi:hypothetical protein
MLSPATGWMEWAERVACTVSRRVSDLAPADPADIAAKPSTAKPISNLRNTGQI